MGGEFESFWPESRKRTNQAFNTRDIEAEYEALVGIHQYFSQVFHPPSSAITYAT